MTSLSNKSINNSLTRANNKEIVSWGTPDYSAGVAISVPKSSATYTAPSAGIYVLAYEGGSSVSGKHILVNDSIVYRYQYTSAANPSFNCFVLLDKGDVLSADTTSSPSTIRFSIFYPMKVF